MSMKVVLLIVLATAVAIYAGGRVHVHSQHNVSPRLSEWRKSSPPSPSTLIPITVAIKQRNLDRLESLFWEVSDPKHASYGQHLSLSEVNDLVSPSDGSIVAVESWLRTAGATRVDFQPGNHFLVATISVADAEKLLEVTFHSFHHLETSHMIIRTEDRPTIPVEISQHVDFIWDVTNWPRMRPASASRAQQEQLEMGQAAQAALEAGPNNPLVPTARPKDTEMSVVFVPRCSEGSFTADASTPCSDAGVGAITSFAVRVESVGFPTASITGNAQQMMCTQCVNAPAALMSACTSLNGTVTSFTMQNVICAANVFNVPNFVPLLTSAQSTYSDGSQSIVGYSVDISGAPAPTVASTWTTPFSLKALYGVPQGMRGMHPENSQSVAEFLQQYYSETDLHLFYTLLGVYPNDVPITVIGPNDPTNPGGEASLDIQYLLGIAPNVKTVFWSVDAYSPYPDTHNNSQEGFLQWVLAVSSSTAVPLVHSVSYLDMELTLPREYTDRVNVELQKLGVRGITTLFASGDDGVASEAARDDNKYCTPFNPVFPASSPYATAVGGTQLSKFSVPASSGGAWLTDVAEMGCDSYYGGVITSGGGFSTYYDRPDYQADAVSNYLTTAASTLPPAYNFRAAGRAYPDISGIAHNYLVVTGGEVSAIHGTSASTPLIAGLVALLNDIRLTAKLPPLGFINPALYQVAKDVPEAYNDVTIGNNRCTVNYRNCCQYGFSAAPGWDPVVGIGSPNFAVFQRLVSDLNSKMNTVAEQQKFTAPAQFISLAISFIVIVVSIMLILRTVRR